MRHQIVFPLTRLLLVGLLVFGFSCQKDEDDKIVSEPATELDATMPQEWMTQAYNTVKRTGLFALDASRVYAYTAITMYESLVHGMDGFRSMEGQLNGLENLPKPDPNKRYDWGIVLCHATPQVLIEMTPNISAGTIFTLNATADRQADALRFQNDVSQEVMKNSKEFADQLAIAIIRWAVNDGRATVLAKTYNEPVRTDNPQFWYGRTLNQSFMAPFWWESRPLAINQAQICQPVAPLDYSTNPNSDYYKEVKEVLDASFDPTKVEIGRFWANDPGVSGSPAGSWIGIANQLVDQFDLDITNTLKMYVLLSVGTRDGFLSCWYTKYRWNLQRPVTYIREVIGVNTWNSPVVTPPYPDYTSGTSVNAGASSQILTYLFGNNRSFTDAQHTDKGLSPRKFNNFRDAGTEAFHSRIFGGVHMRRACAEGFKQGTCVAENIINKLKFEK
jgi:hypothetical protein